MNIDIVEINKTYLRVAFNYTHFPSICGKDKYIRSLSLQAFIFVESHGLGNAAKWWNGVSVKMLSNISTKIHPGAVKFYKEIGASLADHH